jgi:hypothetical protein
MDSKLITGERIQFKCDNFLGTLNDFTFNPNVLRLHKDRCVYLDKLKSEFDNKEFVFCYTHLLSNINLLINKLTYFKNPFKLVFHN